MARGAAILALLAVLQDTAYFNPEPDWTAVPEAGPDASGEPDDSFGFTLAAAGDVDGDGFDDLLVGAPFRDDAPTAGGGKVYLYYGSAAGLSQAPGWTAIGESFALRRFGAPLEGVGDVDGDGFDDFAIGARGLEIGADTEILLFRGSAAGPGATPSWRFTAESVGAAGDVNGDGFADVLVGTEWSGPIYLFYGSAAGLGTQPAWTYVHGDDLLEFGMELEGLGDVDRDGFDDFAIGPSAFRELSGTIHVFHGSPAGPAASPDWTFMEADPGDFGESLDGGDLDGDGFADLLTSARRHGYQEGQEEDPIGRVFIFRGSPEGLSRQPDFVHEPADRAFFGSSVLNMGDLDGDGLSEVAVASRDTLEIFPGTPSGFGTPSRWSHPANRGPQRLGDVNGDGRTDLVLADAQGSRFLAVLVFYGRNGGNPMPPPDVDPPLPPGGEDPPPPADPPTPDPPPAVDPPPADPPPAGDPPPSGGGGDAPGPAPVADDDDDDDRCGALGAEALLLLLLLGRRRLRP